MDRLSEYVKGIKKQIEEIPKGKSPSKSAKAGTSEGSKNESKGKHPYIVGIIGGAPCVNLISQEAFKREIA